MIYYDKFIWLNFTNRAETKIENILELHIDRVCLNEIYSAKRAKI